MGYIPDQPIGFDACSIVASGPPNGRLIDTLTPDKPGIGLRDDSTKLRFDLIPVRPLQNVAEVYTVGAKKYADRNWEKGLSWAKTYGAMLRHMFKWFLGEKRDPDGFHHLAAVVFGAFALMEFEETHPELDDRPKS